ncbi:MAG: Zn-ribbon domain-containing OB-fold protein [Alphaproteobacteria bacterium]|nr:Zn-ribbon domain-containing OB-fold protein [Alphaproteobacteria bacterium]
MGYEKPVPVPDPVTKPFWDGLRARELRIQKCANCAGAVFYPRVLCPACGSRSLSWMVASGKGKVYAFTIAHRGVPSAFKASSPYVVALVDLDEGARIMTNLVDVEPTPAAVKIGMAVLAVFDDVSESTTLLKFRPA